VLRVVGNTDNLEPAALYLYRDWLPASGEEARDFPLYWCDEAGLPPECSAHGLRKAAASRLAEAGATELEIRAITGHQTSKEVNRYTKAASQKLLAGSGMAKLTGNRIAPLAPVADVPPKKNKGIGCGLVPGAGSENQF
jgi:integrase